MAFIDCSSISLAGIVTDCAPSLGGIKTVWLTQYDNVKDVTVAENEISAISMESGAKWYEYQFRKGTGSLTSTLTVDEAAGINYVANEISLVFTKMETAKRIEVAAMSVGKLAAIVLDSNGKYWFLGKDDYVSASAGTGVTGTAKGDQNAYTVTLATDSETYPYEVTEAALKSIGILEA